MMIAEFENHQFLNETALESDYSRKVFIRCTFDHCDFSKSSFKNAKFLGSVQE